MSYNRLTYILLCALSFSASGFLSSCSQEDMPDPVVAEGDDYIIFHTSLPGVESRSYDNIQLGDLVGGFTVAAHNLEQEPDAQGKLSLYFQNVLVERTKGMGDAYRSDQCKWPDNKDGKEGRLRIYAFYPSVETLKEKSGYQAYLDSGKPMPDLESGKEYFLLHDISTTTLFSYRIGNLKVNRDISRHVDVVTAIAEGTKTDNLYTGVNLEFSHKLSRIDFKAWSASPGYIVEIAGIRIGGVIVSTTLNMEGNWIYGSATEKKPVEYIYRAGDTVVTLDGKNSNTQATATSIMGNGGWAMIIPGNQGNNYGKYTAWNTTSNASGVYFSVLMRVIDNSNDTQGLVLYPYEDNALISGTKVKASNKNSVYLVVEKSTGIVKEQVYKKKATKNYYSDAALKTPYTPAEGFEVREYAWAAMPYSPKQWWLAGNSYTYTLDYTKGVGLHAPDDDAPGKTIITPFAVGLSEEGGDWEMVKKYYTVTWEDGKEFKYEQE